MTNWSFEHTADARTALRAIVSDPAYGVAALSNVRVMSEVLPQLLRGARLERSVLVTAARENLSAAMLQHVSEGMNPVLAVRLSANFLAAISAVPIAACYWVAAELALALDLISAEQADELGSDGGAVADEPSAPAERSGLGDGGPDGGERGWRAETPPTVIGTRPPAVAEPVDDEEPWRPASDEGSAAAQPEDDERGAAAQLPPASYGAPAGAPPGQPAGGDPQVTQHSPPGYGHPGRGRAGQQAPGQPQQAPGYAQPPAAPRDAQQGQWSPPGPAGYASPGAGDRQPVAQADDWISRVVRDAVHPGDRKSVV